MAGSGVDWLPGLAALVVGLVVGGLYVWRMRAAGAASPAAPEIPLEQRDLLGKREVLLRQLAELDDAAAKRSPEQLARERYALELETARVLRELDRLPASAPSPAPAGAGAAAVASGAAGPVAGTPIPPAPAGSPALRGFLWGTGTMAALAGLVFLVTQAARPRDPGGQATGELPGMASPGATDPEEASLRARLDQDPDDLDTRLALARVYLERQDMMGVWNETQEVLARAPGHPRALSYQALVRLAMGQAEIALQMLEQAIAADPDMIDAYAPLSLVQMRLGRPEAAARTMAEAKRRFPEQGETLARFEARLQEAAAEPAGTTLEDDPHASLPPPGGSASTAAPPIERAAPLSSPRAVGGRLDLDPALRGEVAGGVLFVVVREAGVETGPPLAVKRLVPSSFPVRFEIGEADSMTGEPLPDAVLVDARLDADGDPASRPPSDPRARVDSVALGTADLALVLRREN